MSYSTVEALKEDLQVRSQVPTRPRAAVSEDRDSAVSALRSLSQQATQLATQIERGQLSESTVMDMCERIDLASRVMVEATRLAFKATRK